MIRILAPMDIIDIINEGFKIGMFQHREEVVGLTSFLAALNPRNVVEIGTFKGGLSFVLSRLCQKLVTVDLENTNGYDFDINARSQMIASWKNATSVLGCSFDVATWQKVRAVFGSEPIDFIMIDGGHQYEPVYRDFFAYFNLVRPGGWVAFHDINDTPRHAELECEVHKLWQQLTGFNRIEINLRQEWGGIGLLQKPY